MDSETDNGRPNIRIQIQNNVSEKPEEKMEVEFEENDNEEGEIHDDNDQDVEETEYTEKKVSYGGTGVFTTGFNIFDKNEQTKLQERAKRFALKPEEIHSFAEEHLQDLYDSLGITPSNENEVKFEQIHLLGLDEMSPEDLLDYFASYAPDGIEWIDDNSCNIVWLDNISAARAMYFKSRPVKDMPVRQPKEVFPKEFLDEVEEPDEATGQSILIKNKNREIELQNEIGQVILPKKKAFLNNSADISEITIPIPPGYWRLGVSHPKTKCLLLRFGLISDKMPFKSEKCSKYYKKLTNPNQKNVIPENRKKELRSIFERNRELHQSKNPWGSLARNWDSDARYREREPVIYNVSDSEEPVIEIKNKKLMARLGVKRKCEDENTENISDDGNSEVSGNEEKEKEELPKQRKKIKIPRMKMYADEEEENMKRKKLLQKMKKQEEEIEKTNTDRDLRNMLGPTSRYMKRDLPPEMNQVEDLGSRLRNRNQKMIFAIERDLFDIPPPIEYLTRDYYPDVREQLSSRSRTEVTNPDRPLLVSRSHRHHNVRERIPSIETRRAIERSHRSGRKHSPERTLHSDHMYSSRRRLHRRSHSPHGRSSQKPRSKVAVVIKTQKKPTVASTIWSKVKQSSDSDGSSSESESEASSSSSDSDSASVVSEDKSDSSSDSSRKRSRNPDRPGFDKTRLSRKLEHKSPLKITMANEHYKNRRRY